MSSRRLRLLIAAILAGSLLLLGGIVVGRFTAATPPLTPTTTSADAGFARDMQKHHHQAVEMSLIIYGKTDDADIRSLSYDIARGQSEQAGQMYGWLAAWGLPQAAPEPEMTWMTRPALEGSGHDHADSANGDSENAGSANGDSANADSENAGSENADSANDDSAMTHMAGDSMPGYATDEQIASLESAVGTEADKIFLDLMIEHHLGGVEMADAVLDRTDTPVVRSLATGVVTAQQSEITYMRQLLAGL